MNKSTQLIIAMVLGFEAGHEILGGAKWDAKTADALLKAPPFSKDDIFSVTSTGKSFFQYKKAWENLRALYDFMAEQGQKIEMADLKKPLMDGKSAIDLAMGCDALQEIFLPEIWAGHSDDLEDMWYSIPKTKRTGKDFTAIRSAIAKLEGRVVREDVLDTMGVPHMTIRNAINNGDIDTAKKKLAEHGDHLRLDDAKIADTDGDHALFANSAWGKFDELYAEWEKHGEIPDADFFLYKRAHLSSIVDCAFKHGRADKIFNAHVFAGRPHELLRLYNSLPEDKKDRVPVNALLSEIIADDCADMLRIDGDLEAENLTEIFYVPDDGMTGWQPVIPLGLKQTWDRMDAIRDILKEKQQDVTLSDLRRCSGFGQETCFLKAVRFGHFKEVLGILADNNERLEAADLLAKNADGENALGILAETKQLDLILSPGLWAGHGDELTLLWENLPDDLRKARKDDFRDVLTHSNLMGLRILQSQAFPVMAAKPA